MGGRREAYWELVYELQNIAETTDLSQAEVFKRIDWESDKEKYILATRSKRDVLEELAEDVWVERWR